MKNKNFWHNLKIAFFGIKSALRTETSFRIQFLAGIVIGILILVFGLNRIEASILILTILVVLVSELINSQIEKFLDIIQPELHPRVKIIKDLSAGAVLLSSLGSIIIGILIFWPHVIQLLGS